MKSNNVQITKDSSKLIAIRKWRFLKKKEQVVQIFVFPYQLFKNRATKNGFCWIKDIFRKRKHCKEFAIISSKIFFKNKLNE